ncbi:hypothetical protein [Methylobacterium brachythecii]|uniref:IclR-ED domain-containing protein n=1 Tax=Methylobacterium brachythecii TaxID=1176177 RepID=A0ABQ6DAX7_9HYPH|nr:hypothetical protein [Methylobacterium brachythecii]GLR00169.1 hypothetical protein GCM10007863_45900 [Dyella mobilis]GLS47150.1 hypothetical protein GCM10007884_51600 [Methylobacterium brachythecii]
MGEKIIPLIEYATKESLLTIPITDQGTVSFAILGDILIANAKLEATIAFAGKRIKEQLKKR